jgi:hypothetical protein
MTDKVDPRSRRRRPISKRSLLSQIKALRSEIRSLEDAHEVELETACQRARDEERLRANGYAILIENPLSPVVHEEHLLGQLPAHWRDRVTNKIRLARRVGQFIVRDAAHALREQDTVVSNKAI